MSKARDIVETLRTVLVDGDVTNANFTGADLDIAKGGTGASTAGAARTALGLAIGSDVQAFNAAIMVDGDIGTTVQAHDADTAKLDANANFTGTLQRGGTDVLVTGDVTNANFTGADLEIAKGGTGASSAGAARTALGLAIGTDVLAPDGSAANLTNLPASGSADFVASGTLPNGKPVILKADGQVEVVAGTSIPTSFPLGPISTIQSSTTYYVQVAFDPSESGKLVAIYRDEGNSGHGTAVVGQVSGTSITFGSEYIFNSAEANYGIISFDPQTAGSFVIQFQDAANSQHLYVVAGSRSGLGLTFGTKVLVDTCNSAVHMNIECDPVNAGKFVTVYRDPTDSNHGKAKVGIISGTSISLGSMYEFNGASGGYYNSLSFDHTSSGKFIVVFYNLNNSGYGTGIVGTITGSTGLSFGSLIIFNSAGTGNTSLAFDPSTANSFVVLYNAGYGRAGTLTNNSFTFGSQVQFTTRVPDEKALAFHPSTAGQFVTVYRDSVSPASGYASIGTVSGNSVTFSTEEVFTETPYPDISLSFDPNLSGMCVIGYRDMSNNYGATRLGQVGARVTTNLTATNFLGTSTAAYTNGQTAKIMLQGGISTNQTSLTIGSTYHVLPTGTLGTSAGTGSVVAGKAVSATTLLLKGI
jgi:hypothetical protein